MDPSEFNKKALTSAPFIGPAEARPRKEAPFCVEDWFLVQPEINRNVLMSKIFKE